MRPGVGLKPCLRNARRPSPCVLVPGSLGSEAGHPRVLCQQLRGAGVEHLWHPEGAGFLGSPPACCSGTRPSPRPRPLPAPVWGPQEPEVEHSEGTNNSHTNSKRRGNFHQPRPHKSSHIFESHLHFLCDWCIKLLQIHTGNCVHKSLPPPAGSPSPRPFRNQGRPFCGYP